MARRLGIHRATLYRWIRAGLPDQPIEAIQARYQPRPAVATKLKPYKPILATRLRAYPQLSAVRLLAELRAAGYSVA